MALEKLSCPQCGGNELQPFGYRTYKCDFCGGTFKDEPELKSAQPPPVPKPHYRAPAGTDFENRIRRRYDPEDDPHDPDSGMKKVMIGVLVFFLVIIAIGARSCFSKQTSDSGMNEDAALARYTDSIIRMNMEAAMPVSMDSEHKEEHHATILSADVELVNTDDSLSAMTAFFAVNPSTQLIILAKKPQGFARKGKKIFVGKSFSVYNKKDQLLFESGDLNASKDSTGEDYRVYKKYAGIPFSIDLQYGFKDRGNYVVRYRIWDKNGPGELSGQFPVMVDNR
jgi:hypothetical protein